MGDYLLHGQPSMLGYRWTLKLDGEVIGEHKDGTEWGAIHWAEETLDKLDEIEWISHDSDRDHPTFTGIVTGL